jgi:hypothetical protein
MTVLTGEKDKIWRLKEKPKNNLGYKNNVCMTYLPAAPIFSSSALDPGCRPLPTFTWDSRMTRDVDDTQPTIRRYFDYPDKTILAGLSLEESIHGHPSRLLLGNSL